MLFGKTVCWFLQYMCMSLLLIYVKCNNSLTSSWSLMRFYLSWDVVFVCIYVPKCMSRLSMFYNNDFISLLKGRLSLLPTICPLSVPLHPKWVPCVFLSLVFLIDPFWWSQVRSSDQYNTRSQMCQVILKPHKNADITAQIAGNYFFASLGKYAQISLYNWSLLKIKAVWGFLVICVCFLQLREQNADCI